MKKCFECENLNGNDSTLKDKFLCKAIKFSFVVDSHIFSYDGKQILLLCSNIIYIFELDKDRGNFCHLKREECDDKFEFQNSFENDNEVIKGFEFIDEHNIFLFSSEHNTRVYNTKERKI